MQGMGSSHHAKAYLTGLLGDSRKKYIERIEEAVEDSDYEGIQHFLSNSTWDHSEVMKHVEQDVNRLLGGNRNSALYIDESGFTKKGKSSVGVQRQWNGRLGKVDNCQCGVFASLGCGKNASLVNFRLYLPESWTTDKDKCLKAKVPEDEIVFKTKIELALELIDDSIERKTEFQWIGADSFYGSSSDFLNGIESRGLDFVCDIRKNHELLVDGEKEFQQVEKIAIKHFCLLRENINVRPSTTGCVQTESCIMDVKRKGKDGNIDCVLIISRDQGGSFKYTLTNRLDKTLQENVYRQHQRFWIEFNFKEAKSDIGMAQYQLRGWIGWHHHICMSCLALLFVTEEKIKLGDDCPLLSASDITELLSYYFPSKKKSEDEVHKQLLSRHKKRYSDMFSKGRKKGAPIDDLYLPK